MLLLTSPQQMFTKKVRKKTHLQIYFASLHNVALLSKTFPLIVFYLNIQFIESNFHPLQRDKGSLFVKRLFLEYMKQQIQ